MIPELIATRNFIAFAILTLALAGMCEQACGQETAGTATSEIVEDEFNRGTPKRSVDGFLKAADAGDYEVAAEYLDLRNLRGAAADFSGEQLARALDIISQRADWIDIDELVDDPAGRSGDSLPGYRDSIGVIVARDRPADDLHSYSCQHPHRGAKFAAGERGDRQHISAPEDSI